MVSSISRYKWVVIPLVVITLGAVFGRGVISSLVTDLTPKTVPTPVVSQPAKYRPFTAVQLCLDTPPWYTYSHEVALAVANKIDASVTSNQGGLVVFVSFIASRSFQKNILTITVPSESAFPVPPSPPQYGSDTYHNAKLKQEYKNAVSDWQKAYANAQKNLTDVQAQVREQTDKLRSLKIPFDNKASEIFGCLENASRDFQYLNGRKFLLIASTLLNNVQEQVSSNLSLAGVSVRAIWHTCEIAAADCASNDANWKKLFLRCRAKDVSFYTIPQSEALQVTF